MLRSTRRLLNLTERQAKPRNLLNYKPTSMLLETHQPVPSNDLFGRPRSNIPWVIATVDADVAVDGLTATFTWTGGLAPFTFDAGDGSPVVAATSPHEHVYALADTYTATITSIIGPSDTVEVVVA